MLLKSELKKHIAATEKYLVMYDASESLMWQHTKEDMYHSKLAGKTVHTIRDSLELAVALMYCCEDDKKKTAFNIIRRVLELQDTDCESDTYGLWSYYLEEPLESMDVPDRNEADFIGKNLVHLLLHFSNELDNELIKKIESACIMACASIIRRNEGVNYTNVAITDCYVTIATGEITNQSKLIHYGVDKLKRFTAFCIANGGVFEYNSPDYSPLAAEDIARIIYDIKDEDARLEAEKANSIIWGMMAQHFLPDIKQFAGPQSRSYRDFVQPKVLKSISLATDGIFKFETDVEDTMSTYWNKPLCPVEYYPYFKGERKERDIRTINMRGFNYPFFAFAQTATTHSTDQWSIGSFNREELWNQRRPLQAYIKNKNDITGFRIRFIHDGYDFSSAQLHCVQNDSAVLGIVNIANNRGNTHISLDTIKNAEIIAEEMLVSFEFTGKTDNITWNKSEDRYYFYIDKTVLYINVFSCDNMHCDVTETDAGIAVKIWFYKGSKCNIRFSDFEKLCCGFAMEFCEDKKEYNPVVTKYTNTHINASWLVNGSCIELSAWKKSGRFMDMMTDDYQYINKVLIEKLYDQPKEEYL